MVSERLQELAGAFSPGFQEKRRCATLVSGSSDGLTKGVRGGELFAFGARLGMIRQKRVPGCHRSPLSDCRVTLRQTRKSPGIAVAAVETLAVGIGANTTSFSASRRTGDCAAVP